MNTVTASFDTTVRQMTETSQWSKCCSKVSLKCLSGKKQQFWWLCTQKSIEKGIISTCSKHCLWSSTS